MQLSLAHQNSFYGVNKYKKNPLWNTFIQIEIFVICMMVLALICWDSAAHSLVLWDISTKDTKALFSLDKCLKMPP